MASKIIKVDEGKNAKQLAFGLNWLSLDGLSSEKSEIKNLSKSAGSLYHVKNSDYGDTIVGFYNGDDKLKGTIYSGSNIFSKFPNIANVSLFVYELGDGSAVVCASKSGKPVVGFDFYGSQSSAINLARDFIAMLSEGVSVYGNSQEFANVENITLKDLAKFAEKDSQITKVGELGKSGLVIMSVSIALLISAYFGWQWYETKKKIEAQKAAEAAAKADPNLVYQTQLKERLPLITGKLSNQWKQINDDLKKFPLDANGWSPRKIECNINKESAICDVEWISTSGTFESFEQAWDVKPQNIRRDIKSQFIKTAYTIHLTHEPIDFKVLPSPDFVNISYVTNLQLIEPMGGRGNLDEARVFNTPPGVSESALDKTKVIFSGKWSMEGDYWLSPALEEVNDNFTMTSIVVEHSVGNLKFRAKGEYYAK